MGIMGFMATLPLSLQIPFGPQQEQDSRSLELLCALETSNCKGLGESRIACFFSTCHVGSNKGLHRNAIAIGMPDDRVAEVKGSLLETITVSNINCLSFPSKLTMEEEEEVNHSSPRKNYLILRLEKHNSIMRLSIV